MAGFTEKQTKFIDHYLVTGNATESARLAGYSAATARQMGAENLSKPDIRDAITARQAARSAKVGLTAEWVVERLMAEAVLIGDGAVHGARIKALELLGKHAGMWKDKAPLEALLDALPPELAGPLRGLLAGKLPGGGGAAGGGAGP
jgi:hypothetical protein